MSQYATHAYVGLGVPDVRLPGILLMHIVPELIWCILQIAIEFLLMPEFDPALCMCDSSQSGG